MNDPSRTAGIPDCLIDFLNRGDSVFRCDDGDWRVELEYAESSPFIGQIPEGAIIIANNGCGDILFLEVDSKGGFGRSVFVFRHEESLSELFSDDVGDLTDPPAPSPSDHGNVFYHDEKTKVMLGDHVSARDIFFRQNGRIVYVPGISEKNREFEHGGLSWVGIRLDNGSITGAIVAPETGSLKKGVRFLSRGGPDFLEIGPYDDLE